jgi:CRISPR-associated endonuclease/helicase Cas3
MTRYFAHSVPGQPEDRWEPLASHLADVAARARLHGDRFGAGELAACAGSLHDLGKYKSRFQARLRGSREKVDHAGAGANFAMAHYGKAMGRILAHAIAGHHAGLKDDLFAPEGRLKRALAELACVEQAARSDGLKLAAGDTQLASFKPSPGEEGFQFAFLTRMLFSCLIDADRMAAAAFEATAAGTEPAHGPAAPIAALESRLADFVASRDRAAAAGPINRLRDQVRDDAVAHAKDAQGVFTLTVPTGGGKTLTGGGAPRRGARIETEGATGRAGTAARRPPQGGADRNLSETMGALGTVKGPRRGRELKLPMSLIMVMANCRPPLAGAGRNGARPRRPQCAGVASTQGARTKTC